MLEMNNICVSFRSERQDKIFGHSRQQVLFGVSLRVEKGTCLGILGESGSGKSTIGRVLCGLLRPDSGEVQLDGISVYASRSGRRNLQNKLSVVFQDYTTSANPRFRVKEIIGEGLTVRERREGSKLDREKEIAYLLELVGLPSDFAKRFPHELSGGQLQRVCIARAVACKPEIILFDEAISSLDAHTQVQIMDLLRELKEKLGLTYIFITHDLTSITYQALNAAKVLSVDYRVRSTARNGLYSWAVQRGVPALLIERGGQGLWSQTEVDACKADVRALMGHLGILDESRENQKQQEIVEASYVEADADGFWYPLAATNQIVCMGEVLGCLESLTGELLQEVRAKFDGVVLYHTIALGVHKGEALIAYGHT